MDEAMQEAYAEIRIGLEKDGLIDENKNRCGFDHHECYEKVCKNCFADEE